MILFNKNNRRRGVSIVEMLIVAALLLMIVVTSLVSIYSMSNLSSRQAEYTAVFNLLKSK